MLSQGLIPGTLGSEPVPYPINYNHYRIQEMKLSDMYISSVKSSVHTFKEDILYIIDLPSKFQKFMIF